MFPDFGEVSETKASGYSDFVNEIQYTGAIYDELTGLLYLNARFYDPSTGRFITQDSYRGEKNDEDTWQLYAYCANNPINYVDPSGHKRIRVRKTILAFGLDVFFTVAVPYIAGPIDIWGHTFKKAIKVFAKPSTRKIGEKTITTLWDDLMTCSIPKIKGYMGSSLTQIRKAIWRSAGVTVPNVLGTGASKSITTAVNAISKYIKRKDIGTAVEFATNFLSLGSIVALVAQLTDSEKPNKSGIAGIVKDGMGSYVYFP